MLFHRIYIASWVDDRVRILRVNYFRKNNCGGVVNGMLFVCIFENYRGNCMKEIYAVRVQIFFKEL